MNYTESLNQLEMKRKAISKRIFISIGIVTLLFIILLLSGSQEFFIFGIVIGVIISIGIILDATTKYKNYFKQTIMPLIITKTNMDIKYEYKNGVKEKDVMKGKLFKTPDRYHCEDLMYGSFMDVKFACSDVHMEERHVTVDSKGRRQVSYVTYFLGRWFVFDFNKEFNGIIQVREDGFMSGPLWGLKTQKISLEDVEFNKKFKTYATNQHDAFYVLTPSLMENIKKLERKNAGKIYFSFIGNELHIAIYNSKDSFEPPIFTPIDDKFIDAQIADILIIKDIINELKLNRKIFKE